MSDVIPATSSASLAAGFSHYPAVPPPISVRLHVFDEHPCAYLPDRVAQMRGVMTDRAEPEVYHRFMDAGFRRSGRLVYQPICRGCRQCRPLRVPVVGFIPNKTQRRCRRRNADLDVVQGRPNADDEAFDLYERYLMHWHGRVENESLDTRRRQFGAFLDDSPVDSIEFRYRDSEGRLLAVGICDRSNDSLSSVYFYFDPGTAGRSLGTYGAIREIEYAKGQKISYYYLGYWISACAAMAYKTRFKPFELLGDDGQWREEPMIG